MCRPRPGPRCSDHSKADVERLGSRYAVYVEQLKAAEAELEAAILAGAATTRLTKRVARLKEQATHAGIKAEKAEIVYHSTPAGQESLQKRIDDDATSEEEKLFLQEEKLMTAAMRKWQNQVYRELRDITRKRGLSEALLRAQMHIDNRQEELATVREQMLAAKEAAEEKPPVLPPNPTRVHADHYRKTMQRIRKAQRFLRNLKRYQFVIALMTDDLETYIKRRADQMTEKAVLGAVGLAFKPFTR